MRPKSEPVDPTPPMPRGLTDFEEKLIERDFLSVFDQIGNTEWLDFRTPVEYAYRCGRSAERLRRGSEQSIEGRKLPSYIEIL